MVRNTCPACGAVTDDPSQKFCTQCGTKLPAMPPESAGIFRAIPAWVFAAAGVVVILVLTAVLWQPMTQVVAGNIAGGRAGIGTADTVTASGDITPLPSAPLSTIPAPQTVPAALPTASLTPAPTTIPATAMTTMVTPRTTATPVTTVPTAIPTPEFTSQITLAVTRVPSQPPSDTYTSKTPGAPYIDPSALEARIHTLINTQRQQNGLSTLSYDTFLADIARGHSYDMAFNNYFEHTDPAGMDAKGRGNWAGYPCIKDYTTYYTSGISENIAMVYRYDTYRNLIAPNGTVMDTVYDWSTEEYIANKVVNGWMNSEGHRKNILDYHFQQEGIGVSFASDDKILITENFC